MAFAAGFPYDINDEPTEDWTIEQAMQRALLRSCQKTYDKRDELVARLQTQFEEGNAQIWEAYRQSVADLNESEGLSRTSNSSELDPATNENVDPSQNASTEASKQTFADETKKKLVAPGIIHVEMVDGPYIGSTFDLKPRNRGPCFIGRSTGKKFRERGISLPNDPEISTSHGKFEVKKKRFFFTDTGSTNGTLYEGKELEVNKPLALENGMVIKVGNTSMKITL